MNSMDKLAVTAETGETGKPMVLLFFVRRSSPGS